MNTLQKLHDVRKTITAALPEFEESDDREILKLALSVVEYKLDCVSEYVGPGQI